MSGHSDRSEAAADRTEDRARAARIYSELTKAQRELLWCIEYWTGRGECVGCGAKGGAQVKCADRLVSLGLAHYEGLCINVDDHEKERPTYSITELGRLVVSIHDNVDALLATGGGGQ